MESKAACFSRYSFLDSEVRKIVFAVSRSLVDQNELGVFSNDTRIEKVKSANLFDRRIVNANQAKRRACGKPVFAETEKRVEFLSVSIRRTSVFVRIRLNVLPSLEGSFAAAIPERKTNPASRARE